MDIRTLIIVALVLSNAWRVGSRLPDWHCDVELWPSALRSNPTDPMALTNTSHWHGDSTAQLERLKSLVIQAWLPDSERQAYVQGLFNLATIEIRDGHIDAANAIATDAINRAPRLFLRAMRQ